MCVYCVCVCEREETGRGRLQACDKTQDIVDKKGAELANTLAKRDTSAHKQKRDHNVQTFILYLCPPFGFESA